MKVCLGAMVLFLFFAGGCQLQKGGGYTVYPKDPPAGMISNELADIGRDLRQLEETSRDDWRELESETPFAKKDEVLLRLDRLQLRLDTAKAAYSRVAVGDRNADWPSQIVRLAGKIAALREKCK